MVKMTKDLEVLLEVCSERLSRSCTSEEAMGMALAIWKVGDMQFDWPNCRPACTIAIGNAIIDAMWVWIGDTKYPVAALMITWHTLTAYLKNKDWRKFNTQRVMDHAEGVLSILESRLCHSDGVECNEKPNMPIYRDCTIVVQCDACSTGG